MGDPTGCGPQITIRAWDALRSEPSSACFVIGDPDLYDDGAAPIRVISAPSEAKDTWATALPVLPLDTPVSGVTLGEASPRHAGSILQSIERAVGLTRAGQAAGVVTNPISKAVLYEAGFEHPGHTEYLATLCSDHGAPPLRPVMMLVGGGLRVALATIHIPLMSVGRALSQDLLTDIARIVDSDLRSRFDIPKPRLVFSGLNPHAGEVGTIGREEIDIINPAGALLRKEGIDIAGARPGDTVFAEALEGRYDAVIAMTHDQGLIPVKTLDLWGGVNCTLGLPIIRTSPDHGTAYEAAAAGIAKPDSLIAAIKLAASMARSS